jgi:hypothetical protein
MVDEDAPSILTFFQKQGDGTDGGTPRPEDTSPSSVLHYFQKGTGAKISENSGSSRNNGGDARGRVTKVHGSSIEYHDEDIGVGEVQGSSTARRGGGAPDGSRPSKARPPQENIMQQKRPPQQDFMQQKRSPQENIMQQKRGRNSDEDVLCLDDVGQGFEGHGGGALGRKKKRVFSVDSEDEY